MAFFPGFSSILLIFCPVRSPSLWFCLFSQAGVLFCTSFAHPINDSLYYHLVAQFVGYGTLICDLERHRRLDVLPDREATSVAAWLRRYPSIEIISRDRSDTYATAAKLGAPQALQVTDKWHLLKNLGEVLQRCLFWRRTEVPHP